MGHQFTLPRSIILKKSSKFQHVYHNGIKFANHYLLIFVYYHQGDERDLVGFAAGKKLGCAVKRNRVKRLLREVYRHARPELKVGMHLILVGRSPCVEAKMQDVARAFYALASKAKLWREKV